MRTMVGWNQLYNTTYRNMSINGYFTPSDDNHDITPETASSESDNHLELIPVYIYVTIMMVISLLGNGVTCYIFGYKLRQTVTRNFIFTLAMLDLISSIICMPSEIYFLATITSFSHPELCKLFRYITYVFHSSTSLILLAIAWDRFYKIRYPLKVFFTVRRSRVYCILSIVISLCLASPSVALYGAKTLPHSTGTTCAIDDHMEQTVWPFIFYSTFALCFCLAAISMIILYSCVIKQIKQLRTNQLIRKRHEKASLMAHSHHVPQPVLNTIHANPSPGICRVEGNQTTPLHTGHLMITPVQSDSGFLDTQNHHTHVGVLPQIRVDDYGHDTERGNLERTCGQNVEHGDAVRTCGQNAEQSDTKRKCGQNVEHDDSERTYGQNAEHNDTEITCGQYVEHHDTERTCGRNVEHSDSERTFEHDAEPCDSEGTYGQNAEYVDKERTCGQNADHGDAVRTFGQNEEHNDTERTCGQNEEHNDTERTFGQNVKHSDSETTFGHDAEPCDSEGTYGQNAEYGDSERTCGQNADHGYTERTCGQNVEQDDSERTFGQDVEQSDTEITCGQNVEHNDMEITCGQNADHADAVRTFGQNEEHGDSKRTCRHDTERQLVHLTVMLRNDVSLTSDLTSGHGTLTNSEDERNEEPEVPTRVVLRRVFTRKKETVNKPQTESRISRRISRQKSNKSTRKTTRMLFSVTLFFVLSFLPFFIIVIIRAYMKDSFYQSIYQHDSAAIFYGIFVRSYLVSNAVNPIIYGILNSHFRQEVKRFMRGKAGKSKNRLTFKVSSDPLKSH